MSTVARQHEPISRAGYERLRAELERLVALRRRQIADGVPAEDSEELEARIDHLTTTLSRVRIVDPPEDGVAGIGSRVRLRMSRGAATQEYELVGPLESDARERRISIDSPVGQALVGRRAGDVVTVEAPAGTRTVEIVDVRSEA